MQHLRTAAIALAVVAATAEAAPAGPPSDDNFQKVFVAQYTDTGSPPQTGPATVVLFPGG